RLQRAEGGGVVMARTLAMFTDTSLCIGCRACQVACKQWNELELEEPEWTGTYQNHAHFTDKTFRLVRFIEAPGAKPNGDLAWLLMSDVCKHCAQLGCLVACPTGAIYRTEYGTATTNQRVEALKAMGFKDAQLYGADSNGFLGGLNAFFLLLAKQATYNLPANPQRPQRNVVVDSLFSIGSAILVGVGTFLAFRERGKGGA